MTSRFCRKSVHDDPADRRDGQHVRHQYDYRNQLIEANVGGQTHLYAYDCLGRRVRTVVDSTGASPVTTDFIYEGWRVLEERQAG